jgi:hypothetical protein
MKQINQSSDSRILRLKPAMTTTPNTVIARAIVRSNPEVNEQKKSELPRNSFLTARNDTTRVQKAESLIYSSVGQRHVKKRNNNSI